MAALITCNGFIVTSVITFLFQTYIDMTFGAGGHSEALLKACPDINIIGLDRDSSALAHGKRLQERYGRC